MSRALHRSPLGLVLGAILLSLSSASAMAAEPDSGTVSPTQPDAAWQGKSYLAGANPLPVAQCPSAAEDPEDLVCDHFTVNVAVDPAYWDNREGGLLVDIESPAADADFDLFVYDAAGKLVGSSAHGGSAESAGVPKASGTYEVRVQPYTVPTATSYVGLASLTTDKLVKTSTRCIRPKKVQPASAPDLSGKQWDMQDMRTPLANETTTGECVVVAVIDTGVDIDHPEFQGRFVSPVSWVCPAGMMVPCEGLQYVDDKHGHGTHVAGTVAAANDGVGITGVAPGATIMPIRVGDDEGSIVGDLAAAVRYATRHGADVITMSIGTVYGLGIIVDNPVVPFDGGNFAAAVQEAADAGILVTLSAGNDAVPYCGQGSQTAADSALCVAAYGPDTDPAVYTDWGVGIDVAAPGGGIITCEGSIWATLPLTNAVDSCSGVAGYGIMSGTSMATPHVAGVGALLAAQGIKGEAARKRILETARGSGLPTLIGSVVAPRVDAAAAVGTP